MRLSLLEHRFQGESREDGPPVTKEQEKPIGQQTIIKKFHVKLPMRKIEEEQGGCVFCGPVDFIFYIEVTNWTAEVKLIGLYGTKVPGN